MENYTPKVAAHLFLPTTQQTSSTNFLGSRIATRVPLVFNLAAVSVRRKISFSGSLTSYLLCPPGTRSNEDRTECLKCENGTASLGGSASCDNCSPALGEFSINEGDVVCSRILPGHYFDDDTKKHLACPAGTFSADGASNLVGCAPCGEGSFSLASAAYCTIAARAVEMVGLRSELTAASLQETTGTKSQR